MTREDGGQMIQVFCRSFLLATLVCSFLAGVIVFFTGKEDGEFLRYILLIEVVCAGFLLDRKVGQL